MTSNDNQNDLPLPENEQSASSSDPVEQPSFRSLKELIDHVTGRNQDFSDSIQDTGLAEILPFPFLAIVGQMEMKLALTLTLINPAIGGVLLIGPRGTGKTTAVRGLLELLPDVKRSKCVYGCTEEDVETGGIDAVCPNCAKKYAEGKALTVTQRSHLVELPLNSRLEDVVGGFDERAMVHDRMRLKQGILSQADQSILYVDEVNLLGDDIVDAILDAAAQGSYTVRRGPLSATYRARFNLIGSMNPEEGNLRPQIMDRFGLRIIIQGLSTSDERKLAYQRAHNYIHHRREFIAQFQEETYLAQKEIQICRERLKKVQLPEDVFEAGIKIIKNLEIDSLRAEISMFEAARALAAADSRTEVSKNDLRTVLPMALRMRQSEYITNYLQDSKKQDQVFYNALDE